MEEKQGRRCRSVGKEGSSGSQSDRRGSSWATPTAGEVKQEVRVRSPWRHEGGLECASDVPEGGGASIHVQEISNLLKEQQRALMSPCSLISSPEELRGLQRGA